MLFLVDVPLRTALGQPVLALLVLVQGGVISSTGLTHTATMTDTGVSWPPPRPTDVTGPRSAVAWVALGVAAYLSSVGLVRLFDYVSVRAQLAQLVEQDGPMSPVFLDGSPRTGLGLVLTWFTDWRALLIWVLAAVVAVAALAVRRPPSG